jgi:SMC interacting uncharacterized protein involved in chromosome segregation
MANIKNINQVATVSPAGVKFLVLKDGKIAHCDISSAIEKAEAFKQSVIDEAIKTATQTAEKLAAKVAQLEKKIEELSGALDALVVEAAPAAESEATEAKTTKSAKKAKKDAE